VRGGGQPQRPLPFFPPPAPPPPLPNTHTHDASSAGFQKILFRITLILLVICLVFAAIIFIRLELQRSDREGTVKNISTVIVILVASIPIAIEVVCTSTLAVGSRRLAEKKIIVARLSAIEELAGMTILCSDKTGTLTLNQLSLRDPIIMGSVTDAEMYFYSTLASKREEGNQDAIDFCMTQKLRNDPALAKHAAQLPNFVELDFEPFNPTDKRTEALIKAPTGEVFKVSKGAPQAVLRLAHNRGDLKGRVDATVQELADRGFRALGLAISHTGKDEPAHWEFLGILSLYDPPRPDTAATVAAAVANGIEVKMVTGDHTLIAKETCRQLGMGTNILNTECFNNKSLPAQQLDEIILSSNGFAEVMPEHKFQIVERLRQQGHVTGMTGDGVNDAPALKRADIGIAVFPCTDAAKAAADIVLTEPGLSVIIDAIFRSRKIFQRMRNYCIYRISCTLQLLFFFFFAIMSIDPASDAFCEQTITPKCVDPNDPNAAADFSFTLPVISLVIITILNDGCMITIAHDKVIPEKRPQRWAMWEVTVVSVVLGAVACLSSMILLVLILKANYGHYKLSGSSSTTGLMFGEQGYVTWMEARTIMYLKISISDFLTLFSARTRVWFWERRPGYALGVACIVATGSSTLLSLFWDKIMKDQDSYMKGLSGSYACLSTWAYCIAWFVVQDVCKVLTYKTLEFLSEKDHQRLARAELRAKVSVGAPRRRWHRRPPPPSSSLSPSPAPLFLTDNPTPCRSPPSSTRTKRRSAFAAALTPRGATVHWQSSAPATPSLLRRCST